MISAAVDTNVNNDGTIIGDVNMGGGSFTNSETGTFEPATGFIADDTALFNNFGTLSPGGSDVIAEVDEPFVLGR